MIGKRLAHYEIVEPLGAGGMGEVYLARDDKLGRQVALKFLPSDVAHDVERTMRFEREARALATLQHTNIAAIYGFENVDGERFLVMEYVEGEDLHARIARGPLAIDDALRIATGIAEGLEAAHEKGIVHRDLKPANVRLTADSVPKILDFGLARALAGEAVEGEDTEVGNPTLTAQVTRPGTILGTAAYMSPEQARGGKLDRRADIWAFGCILYEMLTGRAPFRGETTTDLLADIVKSDPDWSALPPNMPSRVRVLLWRCLQKDPRRRLRDIGEARFELTEAPSDPSGSFAMPGTTLPRQPRRTTWGIGGLVVGGALGILVWSLAQPTNRGVQTDADAAPTPTTRFEFAPTEDIPHIATFWNDLSISPDGGTIVYCTNTGGNRRSYSDARLAARDLGELEIRRISETQGGVLPFFSPDGAWVGYMTSDGTRMMRMPVHGGGASVLADSMQFTWGAHWANDGWIYIAEIGSELTRVSVADGTREVVAEADHSKGEGRFSAPILHPDGKTLFVGVVSANETSKNEIQAIDLQTGARRTITPGVDAIGITPAGNLIFRRRDTIAALRLDPESLEPLGTGLTLIEGVSDDFALSRNGTFVYVSGLPGDRRRGRFIWVDRDGNVEPLNDEILIHPRYPRFSPDGKRVVVTIGPAGQGQLWVYDLVGARPPINLTFEGHNVFATWSRDGSRLAYRASVQLADWRLLTLASDGSEMQPREVPEVSDSNPAAWTSNGRILCWMWNDSTASADIVLVDPDRDDARVPVVVTQFNESFCDLSPDERWLAYQSDRSGAAEIWVQPFPEGAPVRISSDGGNDPVWSTDGSELYYQKGTSLMVVEVTGTEPDFTFKPARELFRDLFQPSATFTPRTYHVHDSGRFLMVDDVTDSEKVPNFVVIQNWFTEVDARLSTGSGLEAEPAN